MKKNRISKTLGFYFPLQFQAAGVIFFMAGIILVPLSYGISVLLSIGALFLIFTTYGYKIDLENNRYKSQYSILGIDLNGWYEMPGVEKVCIRKEKYMKNYRSRVNSYSVSEYRYEVQVDFEDDDYLEVGSFKKAEKAKEKAEFFANLFHVKIKGHAIS